jgi:hypothetical protein
MGSPVKGQVKEKTSLMAEEVSPFCFGYSARISTASFYLSFYVPVTSGLLVLVKH